MSCLSVCACVYFYTILQLRKQLKVEFSTLLIEGTDRANSEVHALFFYLSFHEHVHALFLYLSFHEHVHALFLYLSFHEHVHYKYEAVWTNPKLNPGNVLIKTIHTKQGEILKSSETFCAYFQTNSIYWVSPVCLSALLIKYKHVRKPC